MERDQIHVRILEIEGTLHAKFFKIFPASVSLRKLGRGVARNFLEGDSKSSKISTTMVGQRRGFGMRNG